MGREIRKVPPNWEHPKMECRHSGHGGSCYQPMYDRSFAEAAREWKKAFARWERGERPDYCHEDHGGEYWEWGGDPPDRAYYRPDWPESERTWLQVYETVSEGTPVTPPFATAEELIDYLVQYGDEWDQRRGHGGWGRQAAESFVAREWAPSLIVTGDGRAFGPRDGTPGGSA